MSSVPALRTTDLIGRDAELEELTSQLGIRASEGVQTVRAMLLAGDAGVGKTRVLMALRDVAIDEDWQVVAGHCLDLADSSLPYLPFSEILGRLMADQPDVAARVLEQHPTLARLQPGRRIRSSETASSDQALDRGNVYDAFGDLLSAVAGQAPVLVVVEDAHWADESTRDMLSFLFSRALPGRLAGRVLSRRRPPPTPPASPSGGRVDAAAWRRAAPGRPARRRRRTPPRPCAPPRHHVRGGIRLHRRPGRGQPVLHRGAGGRGVAGDRSPASSPTSCWSTSTASTSPTRRVVRIVSVAGRQVSHGAAGGRVRPRPRRARGGAPHRGRVQRARRLPAAGPTPSATPSSARRSTTTCCRASAPGCTPTSSPRSGRGARDRHRCRAAPSTPAGPTTDRSPSAPPSRPATRPSRSAVPRRPPSHFLDALELIDSAARRCPTTSTHSVSYAAAPRRSSRPGGCPRR